ncbi:MAG: hypothetical protein ACXWHI_07475 [Candidatus Aminicenantales bacterium]
MRKAPVLLLLAIVSVAFLAAQEAPSAANNEKTYPFILRDSPARLFTMRQVDENSLSGFRLFSDALNSELKTVLSYVIQGAFGLLFFKTMTHEEGHRSILVGEDIGSVSHPFPFSERSGYVDGVTDATLQNLRDTKFPVFIRLHTAGFESDYMLATREETLMSLGDESYRNLVVEYLLRKFAIVRYFTEGIFKHDTDGPEEADELRRDIVGNDLYSVIRHLFRPTMAYTRYTRYADLTDQELRYLRRVEWRTFLNLANANVIGVSNFRLSDDLRANVGLGHCMGPFGDFIDEKLWLAYKGKLKINAYLREFENIGRWFLGAGIGINDYPVAKRVDLSAMLHYWNQPLGLSFTEQRGKPGGAVDLTGRYKLLLRPGSRFQCLSLDVGLIYKSAGFVPEETELGESLGVRFGLSLGFSGR